MVCFAENRSAAPFVELPFPNKPELVKPVLSKLKGKGFPFTKINSYRNDQKQLHMDAKESCIWYEPSNKDRCHAQRQLNRISNVVVGPMTPSDKKHRDCDTRLIHIVELSGKTLTIYCNTADDQESLYQTILYLAYRVRRLGAITNCRNPRLACLQLWCQSQPEQATLPLSAVSECFYELNVKLNKTRLAQMLKVPADGETLVHYRDFHALYDNITKYAAVRAIYDANTRNKAIGMSFDEFNSFMKHTQGEEAWTTIDTKTMIERYSKAKAYDDVVPYRLFEAYITDMASNDYFDPKCKREFQDMSRPLRDYLVYSSVGTHVTLGSGVAVLDMSTIENALRSGCRFIELDVWDGPDDEPILRSAYSTNTILLEHALCVIRRFAFVVTPYPLVLSLQIFCSVQTQSTVADMLRSMLQPVLRTSIKPIDSPTSLKGCIVLTSRKLANTTTVPSLRHGTYTPFEDSASLQQALPPPEKLRSLIALHSGYTNRDGVKEQDMMLNVSDAHFPAYTQDDAPCNLVEHNKQYFTKVYPEFSKAANFDPLPAWSMGCQFACSNIQVPDVNCRVQRAMFSLNGSCGYVLKPFFLRSAAQHMQSEDISEHRVIGNDSADCTVTIVGCFNLPRVAGKVISPRVRLSVRSSINDKMHFLTPVVRKNGLNPVWNYDCGFSVYSRSIAVVTISVLHSDTVIADAVIPLQALRSGYRTVHLRSTSIHEAPESRLLIRTQYDTCETLPEMPSSASTTSTENFQAL